MLCPYIYRYLVPGGSAAHFKKEGYTFDVGSSMMFGFGDEGTTNLITKCLESVGKKMPTVPDPTQVFYHLPGVSERGRGVCGEGMGGECVERGGEGGEGKKMPTVPDPHTGLLPPPWCE